MTCCPKCGVEKTDQNTNRRKFAPESKYFDAYCRACRALLSQEDRAKHPGRQAHYDRKSYLNFRAALQGLKSERPCYDCGGNPPPEAKDWDHVRGTKLFEVGLGWNHAWDKVREEMDKCDLVCANCHRIRTKNRRTPKTLCPLKP